jgi:hypothetical protein
MTTVSSTFGSVLGKADSFLKNSYTNGTAGKDKKALAYKAYVVCQEQNIIVDAWLPETLMMDVNATYEAPYAQGLGGSGGGMANMGEMARFLGMSMTTQAMTAQVWQGGAFIEFSLPLVFQAETSPSSDVMLPIKNLLRLTMPKDSGGGGFLTAPGPRFDIKKLGTNGLEAVTQGLGGLKDFAVKQGSEALFGAGKSLVAGKAMDTGSAVAGATSFLSAGADAANGLARTLSSALVNSVTNNISLHVGQFLYFPSVVVTDVSPTYDVLLGQDNNPLRASVNVNFRTFYIPTQNDIDIMFPSTAKSEVSTSGLGSLGNSAMNMANRIGM